MEEYIINTNELVKRFNKWYANLSKQSTDRDSKGNRLDNKGNILEEEAIFDEQ